MTRAELIDRTRQLIAEGDRLVANPSLQALQTWLQLSDELLSAAWGTMDRYHLAWLMVGKPKGIVRGRPMDPAEEAAYVREVAEQKTAALRMSLDAVERQAMPFVGEDGPRHGVGVRRAPLVTQPIRVPAVGGQRDVPAPDAIASDYLLLALRLDQRIPGLVDGYFGPADLKAQVDLEQLRPPARLVEDAARLVDRLDAEVADPARRDWLRVQLVALAAHARALAGEAVPYLDLVERCFDAAPVRRGDGFFEPIAAELDAVVPGRGDLRDRLAGLGRSDDRAADRLPASSTGWSPLPGSGRSTVRVARW